MGNGIYCPLLDAVGPLQYPDLKLGMHLLDKDVGFFEIQDPLNPLPDTSYITAKKLVEVG